MKPINKWPVFARLAFFFAVIALFVLVTRVVSGAVQSREIELFSWADVRYFIAIWAIFTIVYYIGWAIWRFGRKS
jgi:hypothetical protein